MPGLPEALAQARDKVLRYRGTLISEQDTKAALIEPVLRALGWDLEDLDEVRREYRRRPGDNPVDYALLILRTPRLFVEAKGLGENLEDRRWASQIMGYATVAGVEWVVLTNGDEYRIYNSHAPVPVEEKLFRSACLSDSDTLPEGTLGLLSKERMRENWINELWRAHFVDRQVRAVIEGLFSAEPDPSLVRLIGRRAPTLPRTDIRAALARVRLDLDFPVEPRGTAAPPQPTAVAPGTRPRPARRSGRSPRPRAHYEVSLRELIATGLIRPPLDLERTYLGRRLTGRVEADGTITCQGTTYQSLSTSAGVARASVRPTPAGHAYPATNGWTFWQFRDADGRLRPLATLRERYLRRERATGA